MSEKGLEKQKLQRTFCVYSSFSWSSRANIVLSLRRLQKCYCEKGKHAKHLPPSPFFILAWGRWPFEEMKFSARSDQRAASTTVRWRWSENTNRKENLLLFSSPKPEQRRLSHYVAFFLCRLSGDLFHSRLFAELRDAMVMMRKVNRGPRVIEPRSAKWVTNR